MTNLQITPEQTTPFSGVVQSFVSACDKIFKGYDLMLKMARTEFGSDEYLSLSNEFDLIGIEIKAYINGESEVSNA